LVLFSTPPGPPRSALFPYTTLFRSHGRGGPHLVVEHVRPASRDLVDRLIQHRGLLLELEDVVVGDDEKVAGHVRPDQVQVPLARSEEHTSELQSRENLVCRLLLEKK